MFKSVPPKYNPILVEEEVLRFWKSHHIFDKCAALHEGQPDYVFYEAPPTANRKPALSHGVTRLFRDALARYQTMRGRYVPRRTGWNTHGLAVELEVEKRLEINGRAQIEQYGIAQFNEVCRKSVFDYIQDWERLTDRIGFWVNLQDAYVTHTNEYIESLWWILRQLWDKGLLYQAQKVVPYCPRCGTPLAQHELALGYGQAVDPSIYVRLPLVEDPGTALLVWTDAPWTLPGNVAVAASPDIEYVIVERDLPAGEATKKRRSEKLILAKALVEKVFRDEPVRIYETFKGTKLKGLRYRPLFKFILPDKPAYYVLMEDFVTAEEGTGLVHIAPPFGAEDITSSLEAAKKHDLPELKTVQADGTFASEIRPWRGVFVKDADHFIVQDLQERGLLYRSETYAHTYPFCCYCGTPLLYHAHTAWFIRTTQCKDKLVELGQHIQWHPGQVGEGVLGDWLASDADWLLGRQRYWGTPLPIWTCIQCGHQVAVGSVAELSGLAGRKLDDLDLHCPSIDQVAFPCPECDSLMRRVPELVDAWFDSGAMPVAQWHYPFENQELFERQFPADLICEALGPTPKAARSWLYSLHAISAMLFERQAFKHVLCLRPGAEAGEQEMAASHGNPLDPWEVLNQHGADAFRWAVYTASQAEQEGETGQASAQRAAHNFTQALWSLYSFFTAYANLHEWSPQPAFPSLDEHEGNDWPQALDGWLSSRLQLLVQDVTAALEAYDLPGATRPVQSFVADLSRWYVRRWMSRSSWGGETETDRQTAAARIALLYETLVTLSKLLAPLLPFMAEELYQNLVRAVDPDAPESVHLCNWLAAPETRIDDPLISAMSLVKELASLGHAARDKAGIKLHQPLSEVAFAVQSQEDALILGRYAGLVAMLITEDLNVKAVQFLGLADVDQRAEAWTDAVVVAEGAYQAALKIELTPELRREGLARQFVQCVLDFRKKADLDTAIPIDPIHLFISATPVLYEAIEAHRSYIIEETLCVDIQHFDEALIQRTGEAAKRLYTMTELDGQRVTIGIERTG